jgi:hypothetical protein
MKRFLGLTSLMSGILFSAHAQVFPNNPELNDNKGRLFVYWGWNIAWYTHSDISYAGSDYHFKLYDVVAKDKPTAFDAGVYFNPEKATIPQYNFRIGYFINDHYSLSIGTDHMKYVMQSGQTVKISGKIENSATTYDGTYYENDFVVAPDFLLFEHTDGLNYPNIELRRSDCLLGNKKVRLNTIAGLGIGILYPKTNTTLLGKERYDAFHLAGYGLDALVGLNAEFFKHFFIQTELKGGYINMPDIRTTKSKSDFAKQSFFFAQYNVVFGYTFRIKRKDK